MLVTGLVTAFDDHDHDLPAVSCYTKTVYPMSLRQWIEPVQPWTFSQSAASTCVDGVGCPSSL